MIGTALQALCDVGLERLHRDDAELADVLTQEYLRQAKRLSLVASSSLVDPSVLACQASVAVNVTAEGYPGRRFHAGCEGVDEIERLAIERARQAFGAHYVNVQPHAATTANYTVLSSILRPGETLLGMSLDQGGHLTHGSPAAYAGQYFRAVGYGLDEDGRIAYEQVARLAFQHRPRVIVCGATSYPRTVDFARFRQIADDVGAYLVADISHVAGLVVAGLHPSPIDHAHVTTTCTHKQLFGPRGGLIMSGRDAEGPAPRGDSSLAAYLQRAVFPFSQGAPALSIIAGKARALALALTPDFRAVAERIVESARALATSLAERGYQLVSGGTDNHIVLVDLSRSEVSGLVAERALEECYVIVNRNRVPRDTTPAFVTGGIRIGTNGIAQRGMRAAGAHACAELIDFVVSSVRPLGLRAHHLPETVRDMARASVAELCDRYRIPGYPLPMSV